MSRVLPNQNATDKNKAASGSSLEPTKNNKASAEAKIGAGINNQASPDVENASTAKLSKDTETATLNTKAPSAKNATERAVEFRSQEIGTRTTKNEDLFEEQNQRKAEKKQKAKAAQKKTFVIGGSVLGGLIVVGLLIWLVVAIVNGQSDSKDEGLITTNESTEEIVNLSNIATKVDNGEEVDLSFLGDQAGSVESGEDVLRVALEQAQGTNSEDQTKLAQLVYWKDNDDYDYVLEEKDNINLNSLSLEQEHLFWNILCSAAAADEDWELRDKARTKSLELSKQLYDIQKEGTSEE